MKIAIVYNRESKNVINLFGTPNREKYGKRTIKLISDALKKGGHQVTTFEGDKELVGKLEQFMPRVVKGERPGMVFNLSYGIQGRARYTHVPSILEMVGIPYVGSNPLAHSLSLDKVVTKVILRQNGLPTPDFAVLENVDDPLPDLPFPLIVKPKSEAVSFGLKIVHDEAELREAAGVIFESFGQGVLMERFIEGREINVGLLGNQPLDALPPVEIVFGEGGPPIFTYEDKTQRSGREIGHECPAPIGSDLTLQAQELAKKAFFALGLYDCARVDMRLDREGRLWILEVNSLPSLGTSGSYVLAAKQIGLDYDALVNRIVEVASARYFGTPAPAKLEETEVGGRAEAAFSYLIERRDRLEHRLRRWCDISSRTYDPVGKRLAAKEFSETMEDLRLTPVPEHTDDRSHWMWTTKKGYEGGTLLIAHLDVPQKAETPSQAFRRDPEFLYGEGIGSSRSPLVMLEFTMRALKAQRILDRLPLGVFCYSDEGVDATYSARAIGDVSSRAGRVLVLRPGNPGGKAIDERRGEVLYHLSVEGRPMKLGQSGRAMEPLLWLSGKLAELHALSSREERIAVSATEIRTETFPLLLPHRVTAQLEVSYYDLKTLEQTKEKMTRLLLAKGLRVNLEEYSNRPPMTERKVTRGLVRGLKTVAKHWDIPLEMTSSLWPSVAGLVPEAVPVVCGMGPLAEHLYTPQERIHRISLIQRTLLLTQYLLSLSET